MSVAKPWMVESPMPLTCHCEGSLPDRQFSATIAFFGELHCAKACAQKKNTIRTTESLRNMLFASFRTGISAGLHWPWGYTHLLGPAHIEEGGSLAKARVQETRSTEHAQRHPYAALRVTR